MRADCHVTGGLEIRWPPQTPPSSVTDSGSGNGEPPEVGPTLPRPFLYQLKKKKKLSFYFDFKNSYFYLNRMFSCPKFSLNSSDSQSFMEIVQRGRELQGEFLNKHITYFNKYTFLNRKLVSEPSSKHLRLVLKRF